MRANLARPPLSILQHLCHNTTMGHVVATGPNDLYMLLHQSSWLVHQQHCVAQSLADGSQATIL